MPYKSIVELLVYMVSGTYKAEVYNYYMYNFSTKALTITCTRHTHAHSTNHLGMHPLYIFLH